MWSSLRLVQAAAVPVIGLDEAKHHLAVDHDEDDALIERLVRAATATVEGPDGIGIALISQRWRLSLNGFVPGLRLPLGPVLEVVSITYRDPAGAALTLAPDAYDCDLDAEPVLVVPAFGRAWPVPRRAPGVVKVTFTAGYGPAADDVPEDLRHAIIMLVAHWYARREVASERPLAEVPFGASVILERHRRGRLGI